MKIILLRTPPFLAPIIKKIFKNVDNSSAKKRKSNSK